MDNALQIPLGGGGPSDSGTDASVRDQDACEEDDDAATPTVKMASSLRDVSEQEASAGHQGHRRNGGCCGQHKRTAGQEGVTQGIGTGREPRTHLLGRCTACP